MNARFPESILMIKVAIQEQFETLRNLGIYGLLTCWWQQVIGRDFVRCLMLLCPSPDVIKVPALMLCIEIGIRLWTVLVPPDLTQHTNINGAHKLLTECIEAVS